MLGSFPPELVVVSQQPVYSGRRSRRCHVINLLIGCGVGLPTHTFSLSAGQGRIHPGSRQPLSRAVHSGSISTVPRSPVWSSKSERPGAPSTWLGMGAGIGAPPAIWIQ